MENQQKNEQPQQRKQSPGNGSDPQPRKRGPNVWFLIILLAIVGIIFFNSRGEHYEAAYS